MIAYIEWFKAAAQLLGKGGLIETGHGSYRKTGKNTLVIHSS